MVSVIDGGHIICSLDSPTLSLPGEVFSSALLGTSKSLFPQVSSSSFFFFFLFISFRFFSALSPDLTISMLCTNDHYGQCGGRKCSFFFLCLFVMFVSVVLIFLLVKIYSPFLISFILFSQCLSCPDSGNGRWSVWSP